MIDPPHHDPSTFDWRRAAEEAKARRAHQDTNATTQPKDVAKGVAKNTAKGAAKGGVAKRKRKGTRGRKGSRAGSSSK